MSKSDCLHKRTHVRCEPANFAEDGVMALLVGDLKCLDCGTVWTFAGMPSIGDGSAPYALAGGTRAVLPIVAQQAH